MLNSIILKVLYWNRPLPSSSSSSSVWSKSSSAVSGILVGWLAVVTVVDEPVVEVVDAVVDEPGMLIWHLDSWELLAYHSHLTMPF